MAAKELRVENKVWRQTRKSPKWLKDRIVKVLVEIRENPLAGIRLHGELEGYYKYRVGDYRIVYKFDSKNNLVVVVKIEHRQGVYK